MMNRRTFVQTSLAASAVGSVGMPGVLHARGTSDRKVLQAKGLEIVEAGRPVRLRGVNLGGWMLIEDYMIGLPWTEWKIREQFRKLLGIESYSAFFDAYDQAFIADADISFLAQQGFNVVRLPLNYRHFEDDMAPGKWIERGFQQLDRVIGLCRRHNVWVILDLHAAPGAQARDQNAGSAYGETYLWNHREFLDRTVALWAEIARRYNGDATIAGYNLLCEPVTASVPLLNQFYLTTIQAIRKVDPDHLILLDPNLWAKDIASLHDELFADPQVIPALHHYYSESFPALAGLKSYPAVVDGKSLDRDAVSKTLDGKHDQRRIARPVMVAEFGVSRSDAQPFAVQLAITRDLISIFEEKGWSWSMWCYKDLRDMGIVTVRRDTPWRRFLDSPRIAEFMRRYKEMEVPFTRNVEKLLAETDVLPDTRAQWALEVARDFDVPALDFVLRRLAEHPPSELAEMAHSFAFASCEIHQDQLGILTPFLAH
ncbi:MAG: cellulase family glycosylhydrolase [Bryobacteraceae bacterium]